MEPNIFVLVGTTLAVVGHFGHNVLLALGLVQQTTKVIKGGKVTPIFGILFSSAQIAAVLIFLYLLLFHTNVLVEIVQFIRNM